jgi:hypothetical protein
MPTLAGTLRDLEILEVEGIVDPAHPRQVVDLPALRGLWRYLTFSHDAPPTLLG